MLAHGANPNTNDEELKKPLDYANDEDVIRALLLHGACYDETKNDLLPLDELSRAVLNRNSSQVASLAAKSNVFQILEALCYAEALKDRPIDDCLSEHLTKSSAESKNLLLTKHLSTQKLFWASREGNLLKLKEALNGGVNIGELDGHLRTSLHYAASLGYVELVRELLIRGASVHVRDRQLSTPLHLVVGAKLKKANQNGAKVVKLLLLWEADPNAKDVENKMPLFYCKKAKILKKLLLHGAICTEDDIKNKDDLFDEYLSALLLEDRGQVKILSERSDHQTLRRAIQFAVAQGRFAIIELLSLLLANRGESYHTKLR